MKPAPQSKQTALFRGWFLHKPPRTGRALLPGAMRVSNDRSDRGGHRSHVQRVHLTAYECTFPPCNREAVTRVYRHAKNFFSLSFRGSPSGFYARRCCTFLATLLSPVDRGSERCVRCPRASVLFWSFHPFLLNELNETQKLLFLCFSYLLTRKIPFA